LLFDRLWGEEIKKTNEGGKREKTEEGGKMYPPLESSYKEGPEDRGNSSEIMPKRGKKRKNQR